MIVHYQWVRKKLVKRLSELVIPSFIKHFTISYGVSGKPSEIHFITNCLGCNFVTAQLTSVYIQQPELVKKKLNSYSTIGGADEGHLHNYNQ
ncbi:uncharacterized protein LOC141895295 isoform X2 [Acropora palmata]|uniref:uncharacterized protein LOC141895295 isoform X2 n=1 Tax=Acropora palmata TaxID=6131 RepID=UPI003DA1AFD7